LSETPALASKTEEFVLPFKSLETTASSVYPSITANPLADVVQILNWETSLRDSHWQPF
jgi:hypothetical protein